MRSGTTSEPSKLYLLVTDYIMPNTHIEHPEDSILSGDLRVLRWFTEQGNISVKIDGSPAIVWGTNPATKKFFVGTKSVFNKKLMSPLNCPIDEYKN